MSKCSVKKSFVHTTAILSLSREKLWYKRFSPLIEEVKIKVVSLMFCAFWETEDFSRLIIIQYTVEMNILSPSIRVGIKLDVKTLLHLMGLYFKFVKQDFFLILLKT